MIAFVRNLIVHDFWLKLFSLALAVLIWLTVWKVFLAKDFSPTDPFSHLGEQTYFNVPVLVKQAAADVREVQVNPSAVQITVQGDRKQLQNLDVRQIQAEVDLTGIESARGLTKQLEVVLPSGITYTRIVPNQVEVMVPPKP